MAEGSDPPTATPETGSADTAEAPPESHESGRQWSSNDSSPWQWGWYSPPYDSWGQSSWGRSSWNGSGNRSGWSWDNSWSYSNANDTNQGWQHPWSSARADTWANNTRDPDHASDGSGAGSGSGSDGQTPDTTTAGSSSRRDSAGFESQDATGASTTPTQESGGVPGAAASTSAATTASSLDSKGGLSERMALPTFSADQTGDALGSSARSYLRQVDAWCKVTRAPPSQRALLLYQNLTGRAWVEAEELSMDALANEDGVEVFRRWVQERYQEVEVSKIAETLTHFFKKLRREAGQSIREFNSAFDRAHTRLLEIDCRLPEVAKAWAYLSSLGLSNSEELALLASVGNAYDTSKLQRAAVLHEKAIRTPWHARKGNFQDGKGSRPKGAFLTEIGEEEVLEAQSQADSETLLEEEEAAQLHEAFVAAESAKSRYRDLAKARGVDLGVLGRGDARENPKKENSEISFEQRLQAAKAKSFCAGCRRRGHWHKDAECPLNQGRSQTQGSEKPGASTSATGANINQPSKEAYVVQVAYEVGYLGTGLVAITDTACSKSVAGYSWLQHYMKVAKEAGVPMQLIDTQDDFRFGASRLFRATYTATILIPLGDHVCLVRASIVHGEVPLLLSRKALSTLGMFYDVEGHKADFRRIGLYDFPLLTTENGHPAIPVKPQHFSDLQFPSSCEWQGDEIRLVMNVKSASGAYIADVPAVPMSVESTTSTNPKSESVLVTNEGLAAPTIKGDMKEESDIGVFKTIFYPKKLSPVVFNMLSAESLNSDVFMSWWSNTNVSKDFWIETASSFIRIHIKPRKHFFYPDMWDTPQLDVRDLLLEHVGEVRTTESVSCHTLLGIERRHDLWQQARDTAHEALWVGRTVFGRTRPSDGLKAPTPLADDKERADRSSPGPEHHGAHVLEPGRDPHPGAGEAQGDHGDLPDPQGVGKHDQGRSGKEDGRVEDPCSAGGHKRPYDAADKRYNSGLVGAGLHVRTASGAHVQRDPRKLSPVECQRSPGQEERVKRGTSPAGELRGAPHGEEPQDAALRPGGECGHPLQPGPERLSLSGPVGSDVIDRDVVHGPAGSERVSRETFPGQDEPREGICPPQDRLAEEGQRQGGGPDQDGAGHTRGGEGRVCRSEHQVGQSQGQVRRVELFDPHQRDIFHEALSSSCLVEDYESCVQNGVEAAGPQATLPNTSEEFFDCLESADSQVSSEYLARELLRSKDFSFLSAEKILRDVCAAAKAGRKRQITGDGSASISLGAYAHGTFYGIIKKSHENAHALKYVNAFMKHHGAKGSWSAVALNHNTKPLVHRDQHNEKSSVNHTISFGAFSGGRLWLENPSCAQVHSHGSDFSKHTVKDPYGEDVEGYLVSTRENMLTFDPHHKHGVEDWDGDRFTITCYTPRGLEQMTRFERDTLRTFGFPVSPCRDAGFLQHPVSRSNHGWEREHLVRPKKSVRKQLWKGAHRASALLTLGLTVASTYMSEFMPKGSPIDQPVLLEVGDTEMTCRMAEYGDYVVEPCSWGDFLYSDGYAHVVGAVANLKPHVLWVQGNGQVCESIDRLLAAATRQIQQGGVFVMREHCDDPIWQHEVFLSLTSQHDTVYEHQQTYQTVRVAQPGVLPPRPQSAFAGETQADGGQPQAPNEAQDAPQGAAQLLGDGVQGPGLTAGCISFAGNVPKVIQAALGRLHQNLGHPSNSDLTRHLRLAGADEAVIQGCKKLRCEVCSRSRGPAPPRPASLPTLLDFNQLVSVDVFSSFDCNRVKHEFISIIDHATTFHLVRKLEGHSSEAFEKQFTEVWGSVFGPPGTISADLETGLQAGVASYAEFHGCRVRSAAGQAHWQQGVIERHQLWCQEILRRVVDERSIDETDMHMAVQAVNSAKNELRRRHGFSPSQAVFGKNPKSPGELCSGEDEERFLEIMSQVRRRHREVAIRTAARVAFFRTQLDGKLRRALIQTARVKRGGYSVGELVCFFRVDKAGTKSNTKRGRWKGPGTIIGAEGGNWWVSHAGRCHLVAEEHLRPSTAEEVGDVLSTRLARDDLERLLNLDPDDPATFQEHEGDPVAGDADDGGEEIADDEDMDFQFEFPPGDLDVDIPEAPSGSSLPRPSPSSHTPPSKRQRHKGPGVHSANMLKKCHTTRSLEKQCEKEVPWSMIPPEQHAAFRQAEKKQYSEHIDHQALLPLTIEESAAVRDRVDPSRILGSRFAYKDKHWSRRRVQPDLPWKHKARLVISGHKDPDVGCLETDAPTINRLSVLTVLQIVASRRSAHGWQASAGDITAAFLNGDRLERELYLKQPKSGLGDLDPRQLLRVTKGIFGLPDSPRKWWRKLRKDMLELRIDLEGVLHHFVQNPLDPCLFQLVPVDTPQHEPVAYVGVHVDDLLVAGSKETSQKVRDALSGIFPVDGWEIDDFEYIGSHITVTDTGVHVSQQAYAASRLFQVDITPGQNDMDLASEEQKIDNQSLIGALSWLGSQSRPDLQCSVSLAQQLQKSPTVGDVRFTNQTARRAWDHRDKGLWLRPLELNSLEFLIYHDSAWANAELTGEDGFRLSYEDHESGMMHGTPYDTKERKAKRANSKVASQYGIMILLVDGSSFTSGGGPCSVLDWKSTANPRVCRSTFGAETTACTEAIEMGQYVRSFVKTLLSGHLQRVERVAGSQLRCITDCKSLFDHLHKEGIPRIPSDKRLAIDLAALRQHFHEEMLDERIPLYWVPTSFQLADILTKPCNADEWWKTIYGGVRLPFQHKHLS